MATWPATLPQQFRQDGYTRAMPDNLLRSSMDVGPAKVRRRTTANVGPTSGQMLLTYAQKQILEDFYRDDLFDGALPFDFPDWDETVREFRFTRPPSFINTGGDQWMVSLNLERLP